MCLPLDFSPSLNRGQKVLKNQRNKWKHYLCIALSKHITHTQVQDFITVKVSVKNQNNVHDVQHMHISTLFYYFIR